MSRYPKTRYHARQRRREQNAAWAVNAQARLREFEKQNGKGEAQ